MHTLTNRNFVTGLSAAVIALVLAAVPLHASLTVVNNATPPEPNLFNGPSSIMNTLFPGSFSRVDDSVDQLWTANSSNPISVQAAFAGNTQTLGYFPGAVSPLTTTGLGFTNLFTVSGSGYAVTGSSVIPIGLVGTTFRWALESVGNEGTEYFSSLPTDNTLDIPSTMDHMVTFLITGGVHAGDYVIAFEDDIQNPGLGFSSDRDFNDGVFLISGATPIRTPEPSTYLLLASALGLVGLASRKLHVARARIR